MNPYLLNGVSGHYFRSTICKFLKIDLTDIYKTVSKIQSTENNPCIITTKEGKKYELILKEII
jgi:hypothetical protein